MRPGPIRPGDFIELLGHLPSEPHASMRPGPIRPGDSASSSRLLPTTPRFNEAWADSPGRCRTCSPWRRGASRFNEARADSPGRYPVCRRRSGRCSPSFNEARADSPGRSATRRGSWTPRATRFMRPGPIRPGDAGEQPTTFPMSRRSFNEARADSPGRLFSHAGDGERVQHRSRIRAASMRPGPIRPGDMVTKPAPCVFGALLQ